MKSKMLVPYSSAPLIQSLRPHMIEVLALVVGLCTSISVFAYPTASNSRLGSDWTQRTISPSELAEPMSVVGKMAMATSQYGDGTAFYLGKYNGHHLMATNYHVAAATDCVAFAHSPGLSPIPSVANFTTAGIQANCVRYLAGDDVRGWKDIDFSIFEIALAPADAEKLKGLGLLPEFETPIAQDLPLLTAGYGSVGNNSTMTKLLISDDSDCRVLSATGDYRFIPDPDKHSPSPFSTWAFAEGCDGSPGDSGSPILDRATGEWVGLIYTGATPKIAAVQDSKSLAALVDRQDPMIWNQVNYGVPAQKIAEVLQSLAGSGKLSSNDQTTLQAWLNKVDSNR